MSSSCCEIFAWINKNVAFHWDCFFLSPVRLRNNVEVEKDVIVEKGRRFKNTSWRNQKVLLFFVQWRSTNSFFNPPQELCKSRSVNWHIFVSDFKKLQSSSLRKTLKSSFWFWKEKNWQGETSKPKHFSFPTRPISSASQDRQSPASSECLQLRVLNFQHFHSLHSSQLAQKRSIEDLIKMSFAFPQQPAVPTAIHPVLPATAHRNRNAFCVNRIDFLLRENASTAASMVIMAIRREASAFHAQLDVPPVAATLV